MTRSRNLIALILTLVMSIACADAPAPVDGDEAAALAERCAGLNSDAGDGVECLCLSDADAIAACLECVDGEPGARWSDGTCFDPVVVWDVYYHPDACDELGASSRAACDRCTDRGGSFAPDRPPLDLESGECIETSSRTF